VRAVKRDLSLGTVQATSTLESTSRESEKMEICEISVRLPLRWYGFGSEFGFDVGTDRTAASETVEGEERTSRRVAG
jgi:hypothetical protein